MERFVTRTTVALALGLGLTLALLYTLSVNPRRALADPGDLFVRTDGTGTVCTQDTPCTLQTALAQATDGDTIYVAQGTYTGTGSAVVTVTQSITLAGGWDGATSGDVVRAPDAYPSTLDGENARRGVYISGDITPTLDGFIVTRGNASNVATNPGCGGGIYSSGANPVISDSVISGNVACADCGTDVGQGGGIYFTDVSVAVFVSNSIIVSNTAGTGYEGGQGGGLYLYNSPATLIGNTIAVNTASPSGAGDGGGSVFVNSFATLIGNIIAGNTASFTDEGAGGGLCFYGSPATLIDNTIQDNTATAGKGYGGGLYLSNSDTTFSSNVIRGNIASTAGYGEGGGVRVSMSAVTLDGNTITSNTATLNSTAAGRGGGLQIDRSILFTLTNNIVVDNHANTQGSGLWIHGLFDYPTSGQLLHNTIADNHGIGEGIFVDEYTTLVFTNTIIAGHSSVGITVTAGSAVRLESTLWYNGGPDTGGGGTIEIGANNIYEDPAFANPVAWDYHLISDSPAVDAGVDAGIDTDIDGDARPWPVGGGYDIGADEARWLPVYLPLVLRDD